MRLFSERKYERPFLLVGKLGKLETKISRVFHWFGGSTRRLVRIDNLSEWRVDLMIRSFTGRSQRPPQLEKRLPPAHPAYVAFFSIYLFICARLNTLFQLHENANILVRIIITTIVSFYLPQDHSHLFGVSRVSVTSCMLIDLAWPLPLEVIMYWETCK